MICRVTAAVAATTTLLILIISPSVTHSKIYHRCELAYELREIHEIPDHQLATWLCIVNYESRYNTSAHNPGSGDHGLFQISEIYWCSPPGSGTACGLPCSALKDDDIEDDVICARRIYREHKRFAGDGFTAWVVYDRYCRDPQHVQEFLEGCFDQDNTINKHGYYQSVYQAMQLPTVTVPAPVNMTIEVPTTSSTPMMTTTTPPKSTRAPFRITTTSRTSATPAAPFRTSPATKTSSRSPYKTPRPPTMKSTKKPSFTFTTAPPKATRITPGTHKSYISSRTTFSTYKPFLKRFSSTTPRALQSSKKYTFATSSPKRNYTSSKGVSLRVGGVIRSRGTQTPLPFTLKSGVKPFQFEENEKVYAFVNNGGYAYAISSNGFKLFKTD